MSQFYARSPASKCMVIIILGTTCINLIPISQTLICTDNAMDQTQVFEIFSVQNV